MPEAEKPHAGVVGYIINLETAADRREHMQQVSSCFDIPLQFFSALTPANLPERWRAFFYDDNGQPWADLKPGEIACYASHLEVMSRAVSRNVPVLIAEDDLRPLVGQINITELLQRLPGDWGFVRLSGNLKSPARVCGKAGEPVIVETTRQPNNMGLYLVSPQGARQFIEYSTKRFRAIDEDLRRTWEHGAVNYCTASKLVEINIFDSNIDAAGDRGDLPERKRTCSVGPSAAAELVKKIRWNLTRFGFKDSMRMLLNMLANKRKKKPNRRWLLD